MKGIIYFFYLRIAFVKECLENNLAKKRVSNNNFQIKINAFNKTVQGQCATACFSSCHCYVVYFYV